MRDRIEIEEIFEADPQARAEFDTVCDEWQNDAIEAQELAERKRKAAAEMFWFIQKRRQQGDWDWKKWKKACNYLKLCYTKSSEWEKYDDLSNYEYEC